MPFLLEKLVQRVREERFLVCKEYRREERFLNWQQSREIFDQFLGGGTIDENIIGVPKCEKKVHYQIIDFSNIVVVILDFSL